MANVTVEGAWGDGIAHGRLGINSGHTITVWSRSQHKARELIGKDAIGRIPKRRRERCSDCHRHGSR
jgi:hypothetical protein